MLPIAFFISPKFKENYEDLSELRGLILTIIARSIINPRWLCCFSTRWNLSSLFLSQNHKYRILQWDYFTAMVTKVVTMNKVKQQCVACLNVYQTSFFNMWRTLPSNGAFVIDETSLNILKKLFYLSQIRILNLVLRSKLEQKRRKTFEAEQK